MLKKTLPLLFLCGMLSANFDITLIVVDGFMKIIDPSIKAEDLEGFFAKLEKLVEGAGCDLVISFSEDAANVPECIRKYQI